MDCEADCPICLCPILSSSVPWGVSAPCGHAYHRECWDNVVVNHLRNYGGGGDDRRRSRNNNNNNNAPCAICKGDTTGFVPVFIDLGGGSSGGYISKPQEKGVIEIDVEKEGEENNDEAKAEEEKLQEEWDELGHELEKLCGDNDYDDDDDDDYEREMTTASSSSVVERKEDREIARICVAIDLTQPSPPAKSSDAGQRGNYRAEEEDQEELREHRKRNHNYDKIKRTLKRLKTIHHCITNIQSCKKMGGTNQHQQQRYLERLRAKITKLQSDNTELHRTSSTLQKSNTLLSAKLAESEKISSDFIVEMERSKLKYESLHKHHQQNQKENARLVAQYTNEKSTLTNTILKLRQQNKELMEDVSLENTKELEEVRTRYAKMSQAIHDAKMERNKAVLELTRKVDELERRCQQEKYDHQLLKCRMDEERFTRMSHIGSGTVRTEGHGDGGAVATVRKVALKHQRGAFLNETLVKSGTIQQRSSGNRALDALNTTSSRKFSMQVDHPPTRRHYSHQNAPIKRHSTASSSPNEEGDEENEVASKGVQLLMRTGDIRHRSSKKRRSNHTGGIEELTSSNEGHSGKENSNHSDCSNGTTTMTSLKSSNILESVGGIVSTELSSRGRATFVVALHSPSTKRQGGIKSFFKPTNMH